MDKLIIKGGNKLSGSVDISGAKNAALPIIAASLMAEGEVILKNIPNLSDVHSMLDILAVLGVNSDYNPETKILKLNTVDENQFTAPYELVSKMRASICVLGPLLAKRKKAVVSMPGGCVIGFRPIDLHIKGLSKLGVNINIDGGYIKADAGSNFKGNDLFLGGAFGSTVTGTANLICAATMAKGTTVIENAACEPEVQDLCNFLVKMGAKITGIGSPLIKITGVESLKGTEYEIIPDRIEAGTFAALALSSRSKITINNLSKKHLFAPLDKLKEIGCSFEFNNNKCDIIPSEKYNPVEINTLPYPGFPTDLQAQFASVLCVINGISVITEKIYPDRFMYIAELIRMGANIHKEGNSIIISGVKRLSGAEVMASDLRASAALLIAAVSAEGETTIKRVYHIDRGYEDIEKKLKAIGVNIERTVDKKYIVVDE